MEDRRKKPDGDTLKAAMKVLIMESCHLPLPELCNAITHVVSLFKVRSMGKS